MSSFRLKAIAVLIGVWVLAGLVIYFVRSAKPTPEAVLAYTAKHPLEGRPPAERQETLEKLAGKLNQLTFEQRREVRMGRKMDSLYRSLTPEEQTRFLDLTMPAGFKQMMDSFNKMEPAKRKKIVDDALRDMRRQGDDAPPPPDDPNMQKIMEHGLHAFYSEASAETKLDLAPVIEQMQRNMQGLH